MSFLTNISSKISLEKASTFEWIFIQGWKAFFLSEMGWIRKIKRLDTGEGAENAKMHPIESDLLPLKMTCFPVYQLSSLTKDQYW
jgi:hypothetical protein